MRRSAGDNTTNTPISMMNYGNNETRVNPESQTRRDQASLGLSPLQAEGAPVREGERRGCRRLPDATRRLKDTNLTTTITELRNFPKRNRK